MFSKWLWQKQGACPTVLPPRGAPCQETPQVSYVSRTTSDMALSHCNSAYPASIFVFLYPLWPMPPAPLLLTQAASSPTPNSVRLQLAFPLGTSPQAIFILKAVLQQTQKHRAVWENFEVLLALVLSLRLLAPWLRGLLEAFLDVFVFPGLMIQLQDRLKTPTALTSPSYYSYHVIQWHKGRKEHWTGSRDAWCSVEVLMRPLCSCTVQGHTFPLAESQISLLKNRLAPA